MELETPGGRTLAMSSAASKSPAGCFAFDCDDLTFSTFVNGDQDHPSIREYDFDTRTWTTTTPEGYTKSVELDEKGRVHQIEIPGIHPVVYTYEPDCVGDNCGDGCAQPPCLPVRERLTSVSQGVAPDARTISFTYDLATGLLQEMTGPLGITTTITERDAVGRVESTTLPEGGALTAGYDDDGNPTSISPPGRPPHEFGYTPLGQGASYTTPPAAPGGQADTTLYGYDFDRMPNHVVWADGQEASFEYDDGDRDGKLDSVTAGGEQISFGYYAEDVDGDGKKGQLETITDPGGHTLTYRWDGFLPMSEELSGGAAGTVSWDYDEKLQVSSETAAGKTILVTYDLDGVPATVGDLEIKRVAVGAADDPPGFLDGTELPADQPLVTDSYDYNAFGEMDHYEVEHSGAGYFAVDYARDALGRITSITEDIRDINGNLEPGRTHVYAYGPDGDGNGVRLHRATIQGNTETYTYDANGNRLEVGDYEAVYDAQDRLLELRDDANDPATTKVTYDYNDRGQLEAKHDLRGGPPEELTTYTYDVRGNLRSVVLPGGATINYIIDGRNRRIGRTSGGIVTHLFLYRDALNPVARLRADNTILSRYVYATKGHVPDYMIRYDAQGANETGTYRILSDHLGSPRLVVNVATGDVVQRMDYDAWGNMLTDDIAAGFEPIPFGFAGGVYDRETKLVRFGARDYDAEIGRWTATDPILFAGGSTSLYAYVSSNPVNTVDPTGLAHHDATETMCMMKMAEKHYHDSIYGVPREYIGQAFLGTLLRATYMHSLGSYDFLYNKETTNDTFTVKGKPMASGPFGNYFIGYVIATSFGDIGLWGALVGGDGFASFKYIDGEIHLFEGDDPEDVQLIKQGYADALADQGKPFDFSKCGGKGGCRQ